jgi:hypothetical protein
MSIQPFNFVALPSEVQSRVVSFLAQAHQAAYFCTCQERYTEYKLQFLQALFKNILEDQKWTSERKSYAIEVSKEESSDKLKCIRNGILAMFFEWSFSSIRSDLSNQSENYPYARDETLLRKLILVSRDKNEIRFYDEITPKGWYETYLALMAEEVVEPETLHLEQYIPWSNDTLIRTALALGNRHVKEVTLLFEHWTSSQLTTIVEAIKNSPKIQNAVLVNYDRRLVPSEPQQQFSTEMFNEAKKIADSKFNIYEGHFYIRPALILERKS